MEIHKPKPVHGWREFLSEVGIIVIGVTIALLGEQLVDMIHWHRKVKAIEDAMRIELSGDDLPQAYARVVISRCLDTQLDELQKIAKTGTNGAAFVTKARIYHPPSPTWETFAEQIALQSDVGSHAGADQIQGWAMTYANIPFLRDLMAREEEGTRRLQHNELSGHPITQQDARELSHQIDDLRNANHDIVLNSIGLLRRGERVLGAGVSDAQRKQMLDDTRKTYGDCAIAPTLEQYDLNTAAVRRRSTTR